jgi:4-hydroxy-3-methylbut-2-enyl diphosphate reductase
MTAFGAFAQIIPGIDGLIHISQIANQRVEKPQDVLKVGEEVDVKITNVDFDAKRVSLSIRALLEDKPAEEAVEEAVEAAE